MGINMSSVKIIVMKGDITEVDCDAIVNPANSLMLMGGGVAGAIKRKGGEEIEEEARRHAPVPVGEAIVTTAGKLKAKYVIHAPTMERPAMPTSYEKVVKAVLAALKRSNELDIKCIAFPGMGTGVGGLSAREGAEAIRDALLEFLRKSEVKVREILLVAFTDDLYNEFSRIRDEILRLI